MTKSRKNIYDPVYIAERENITQEQAVDYIINFKKNKATSKTNFIKKYGEEKGLEKYNDWKERSLNKGHGGGGEKSRFSKLHYIAHGHSEQEATKLALEYQYVNSPLHVLYYTTRGYDENYAKMQISLIHQKKLGIDYLAKLCKEKNPNFSEEEIKEFCRNKRDTSSKEKIGVDKFLEKIEKTRKTFEEKNLWTKLENLDEYRRYRHDVWTHTNFKDLKSLANYEKRGLAGKEGAYHLDHKYSISMGFINKVPAEMIGSIQNLHFIPWKENISKQNKCSITVEELEGNTNED
jgi:hypothetical protein